MLYRIYRLFILLIIFFGSSVFAQELFPLNQSASSVPKGVVGVRLYSQNFKEVLRTRSLEVLQIMYGVTPRFSVIASTSVSNHHSTHLPVDLITHTHTGNQTNYYTHNIKRGVKYPYTYNGIDLYAKYRFISIDRKNEHVRVALYGEWSNVAQAHDEAEPNLLDDTGGYGYGAIATWLKNRFAASFNYGVIKPNSYFETQPDFTGGPDLPTKLYYGDAIRYNLSLGYRIYPKHYTDYNQSNWNLYLEFLGKKYNAARVIQNGVSLVTQANALTKGSYVEIHPGVQYLPKSNLRFDVSLGLNLISHSYVHFAPIWTFGMQRYFYSLHKPKHG